MDTGTPSPSDSTTSWKALLIAAPSLVLAGLILTQTSSQAAPKPAADAPKAPAAVLITSDVKVTGERRGAPIAGPVSYDPIVVLLRTAPDGKPVKTYPPDAPAGVIASASARSLLHVRACEARTATLTECTVEINDAGLPSGTYTGSVDVTDNDDTKDAVALTVTVHDAIGWPLLALALTVLVFGLKVPLARHWLALIGLDQRRAKFITAAAAKIETHGYSLDSAAGLADLARKRDAFSTAVLASDQSEGCKTASAALTELDAALKTYRDGIDPKWKRLNEAGAKLGKGLHGLLRRLLGPDDATEPEAVAVVRVLAAEHKPRPIPTADVSATFARWDALAAFAPAWRAAADDLARHLEMAATLPRESMHPDHLALLSNAVAGLKEGARVMVQDVAAAAGLASLDARLELEKHKQTVRFLDELYHDLAVEAGQTKGERKDKMVELGVDWAGVAEGMLTGASALLAQVAPVVENWLLRVFLFAAVLIPLLVATMLTSYAGKPFGSLTDYLSLIFVAGLSVAGSAALSDALKPLVEKQSG